MRVGPNAGPQVDTLSVTCDYGDNRGRFPTLRDWRSLSYDDAGVRTAKLG